MLRSTLRRDHGFTLIELMIVVAILGILAGLMTGVIGYIQNSAKVTTRAVIIQTMRFNLVNLRIHNSSWVSSSTRVSL